MYMEYGRRSYDRIHAEGLQLDKTIISTYVVFSLYVVVVSIACFLSTYVSAVGAREKAN